MKDTVDLDHVATSIVAAFPTLDLLEQRLSFELYRLLAEGGPVPRETLAQRLTVPVTVVTRILERWPGAFYDSQRRVVGYWGLSISVAHASPHQLTVGGRKLSAWCAWDTLFLPQILGQSAEIESTSPRSRSVVRLIVSPDRVEFVDPITTHVSFLLPDAKGAHEDVVTAFCRFVHFFPSRQAAESWATDHAEIFVLSVHEAYTVARLKNKAQYNQLLS